MEPSQKEINPEWREVEARAGAQRSGAAIGAGIKFSTILSTVCRKVFTPPSNAYTSPWAPLNIVSVSNRAYPLDFRSDGNKNQ